MKYMKFSYMSRSRRTNRLLVIIVVVALTAVFVTWGRFAVLPDFLAEDGGKTPERGQKAEGQLCDAMHSFDVDRINEILSSTK